MGDAQDMRGKLSTSILAAWLWASWAWGVAVVWRRRGLFDFIGVDFALLSAGARLIASGHAVSVYDLASVARGIIPFTDYYGPGADPPKVGPLPYPPPAILLYGPYLPFRPPIGFLLWLIVNVGLALAIVRPLTNPLPARSWTLTALVFSYLPVVYGLFVSPRLPRLGAGPRLPGRPLVRRPLVEGAIPPDPDSDPHLQAALAVRPRRLDDRDGHRLASLAAFGAEGAAALLKTFRSISDFRPTLSIIYAHQMINWRGLLLNVLPADLPDPVLVRLTLLLSSLTVATLPVIWRGPWEPGRPDFPRRMLATLLVTMLVSFHSHTHGATLLLVPGVALMARDPGSRILSGLVRASLILPTITLAATFTPAAGSLEFVVFMATALILILASELRASQGRPARPHPRADERKTGLVRDPT